MEELQYRTATNTDLAAMKTLTALAYGRYRHELDEASWQKMSNSIEDDQVYLHLLSKGKGFVCETGNRMIGMAFIMPRQTPHPFFKPEWAHIRLVGVDPAFSGKGIGSKLTQLCIDGKNAEQTIALHTSEMQQPAMAIYEKHGFRKYHSFELFNKPYWILTFDVGQRMNSILYHKAAGETDAQTLANLRLAMATELSKDAPNPVDAEELRKQLFNYFSTVSGNTCISVIATVNGSVAGIGSVHLRDMPANLRNMSGKWGYIMNMYTVPEYRKRGICSGILNRLMEEASKPGYATFELHAAPLGQPVYLNNGFVIHDEPTLRKFISAP